MHVGLKIIDLRKSKGFRQTDLAERAGISQAIISRVEKGTRNPTPKMLEKIAVALGCEFTDITPKTDYQTACLLKAVKGMTEPQIKMVTLYANFLMSQKVRDM